MAEILKQKSPVAGQQRFGDLSRPITDIDEERINARRVENGLAFDALSRGVGCVRTAGRDCWEAID
jgi:hypothetical protein